MPELSLQKIPFTQDADNKLRMLKARTGITPNILCRIGLCLSLDEPGDPKPTPTEQKTGREINRYTLFGQYDVLFTRLLAVSGQKHLDDLLVRHLHRGIDLLNQRYQDILFTI